jgi:hypothetical protein
MIDKTERAGLRKALVSAGAPDTSLRGVIQSILAKVGRTFAGKAGEAIMTDATKYIAPILDGTKEVIRSRAEELFARPE